MFIGKVETKKKLVVLVIGEADQQAVILDFPQNSRRKKRGIWMRLQKKGAHLTFKINVLDYKKEIIQPSDPKN